MLHKILLFASIDSHRYHDNGERAGAYKKKDYGVGKYSVGLLPQNVPNAIVELCSIFKDATEQNILKISAAFHCLFEHYHSFTDCNGRTGCWLLNYSLVLYNHPPVIIDSCDKGAYYRCLELFDINEDSNSMYSFLKSQVEKHCGAYFRDMI